MTKEERRIAWGVAVAASVLMLILSMIGPGSRVRLNGSSDGRYHTCGYVTEQGVTEFLGAYYERCGS